VLSDGSDPVIVEDAATAASVTFVSARCQTAEDMPAVSGKYCKPKVRHAAAVA